MEIKPKKGPLVKPIESRDKIRKDLQKQKALEERIQEINDAKHLEPGEVISYDEKGNPIQYKPLKYHKKV